MSLYQLSKFMYEINRSPAAKDLFASDRDALLARFDLSDDERGAVLHEDIGLLYVLGVNGQLLMHFAALCGIAWPDYLQAMRDGVRIHGPVRAGLYAMTTGFNDKIAGV